MTEFHTFLIADDHPQVRSLIRDILDAPGRTFVECGDGAAAIEAHIQHQPDITLIDIEMPVMDGLTATRSIVQRCPDACVVIVTQFDDNRIKKLSLATGAKAFLPKSQLHILPSFLSEL